MSKLQELTTFLIQELKKHPEGTKQKPLCEAALKSGFKAADFRTPLPKLAATILWKAYWDGEIGANNGVYYPPREKDNE